MIGRLDGHLLVHPELAAELLELLDLLGEVLRHGGGDLLTDIADRYHPGMHAHLVEVIDTHASQLRRATTIHKGHK
ncbi:MAG TPA: hypothetical protein VFC00_05460 [Micromonosporaceae bacterium]|nr:hypothetical protein [Micromonosporaceae bacterium]